MRRSSGSHFNLDEIDDSIWARPVVFNLVMRPVPFQSFSNTSSNHAFASTADNLKDVVIASVRCDCSCFEMTECLPKVILCLSKTSSVVVSQHALNLRCEVPGDAIATFFLDSTHVRDSSDILEKSLD